MPRGKRKTQLEKLREELITVENGILDHKSAVKSLEVRAKQIKDEISLEEFKEVTSILEGKNMSLSDLKDLLTEDEK
jgi:hypothetical protein